MLLNRLYCNLNPLIPRSLQISLRRQIVAQKGKSYSNVWPIDPAAGKPPDGWSSWPEQKRFALVLTHDVDTARGHEKCQQFTQMEKSLGFLSSFNFVPERYEVSPELRHHLTSNGFEVGVHGLKHDGKLYASKKIFQERAIKINHYLKEWESAGFRSPSMHHNLEWLHELNIEYDASTFDTDPFEPQSDGVGTIFPFTVFKKPADDPASPPASFPASKLPSFFAELPYTLPQDSTVFVLMEEKTIHIWKQKLDWIVEKGGMALLNAHPDYMNFDGKRLRIEEYPAQYYREFLDYIKTKYRGHYWHALPKEMARFWVSNMVNK